MPRDYIQRKSKRVSSGTDHESFIDLRGVAKLSEASACAALEGRASAQNRLVSAHVANSAYRSTQGRQSRSSRQVAQNNEQHTKYLAERSVLQSEESIKRVKLSVLRALHEQSNAGSVNLKEVSAALDKVLR